MVPGGAGHDGVGRDGANVYHAKPSDGRVGVVPFWGFYLVICFLFGFLIIYLLLSCYCLIGLSYLHQLRLLPSVYLLCFVLGASTLLQCLYLCLLVKTHHHV